MDWVLLGLIVGIAIIVAYAEFSNQYEKRRRDTPEEVDDMRFWEEIKKDEGDGRHRA